MRNSIPAYMILITVAFNHYTRTNNYSGYPYIHSQTIIILMYKYLQRCHNHHVTHPSAISLQYQNVCERYLLSSINLFIVRRLFIPCRMPIKCCKYHVAIMTDLLLLIFWIFLLFITWYPVWMLTFMGISLKGVKQSMIQGTNTSVIKTITMTTKPHCSNLGIYTYAICHYHQYK